MPSDDFSDVKLDALAVPKEASSKALVLKKLVKMVLAVLVVAIYMVFMYNIEDLLAGATGKQILANRIVATVAYFLALLVIAFC
jgi:hypothetical protein